MDEKNIHNETSYDSTLFVQLRMRKNYFFDTECV